MLSGPVLSSPPRRCRSPCRTVFRAFCALKSNRLSCRLLKLRSVSFEMGLLMSSGGDTAGRDVCGAPTVVLLLVAVGPVFAAAAAAALAFGEPGADDAGELLCTPSPLPFFAILLVDLSCAVGELVESELVVVLVLVLLLFVLVVLVLVLALAFAAAAAAAALVSPLAAPPADPPRLLLFTPCSSLRPHPCSPVGFLSAFAVEEEEKEKGFDLAAALLPPARPSPSLPTGAVVDVAVSAGASRR